MAAKEHRALPPVLLSLFPHLFIHACSDSSTPPFFRIGESHLRTLECSKRGKPLKKDYPTPHPYDVPSGGALPLAQTWDLKEAALLKGQAASGGHSISSERGCRGFKAEPNQTRNVQIPMKLTLWGRETESKQ